MSISLENTRQLQYVDVSRRELQQVCVPLLMPSYLLTSKHIFPQRRDSQLLQTAFLYEGVTVEM
jgi:hypothetical protein